MKIPITKYGLPQVVLYPAGLIAVMILCIFLSWLGIGLWIVEGVLLVILIWVIAFFRDPRRVVPAEKDLLISPADGLVTDITKVDHAEFIDAPALRIGIFLSIFNVHINRAPCDVVVEKTVYKEGKFKNALSPASGAENESNDLYLRRVGEPADKLIVRQISGAIARRIVCKAGEGSQLKAGEKFGMIKFGSRTELYVPLSENIECLVEMGDKVKAGVTGLVRYKKCRK